MTRTEDDDDTGEDIEREIPFLKGYTVFNVEQIEGLPELFYAKAEASSRRSSASTTPRNSSSISPSFEARRQPRLLREEPDFMQMPPIEAFRDAESYYATLTHECTHWTRHPSRLDRDFGRKAWGDEGYAREELVAELGSAFLCADLELTPEVREDHASYIATGSKCSRTTSAPSSRPRLTHRAPSIFSTGCSCSPLRRPPHKRSRRLLTRQVNFRFASSRLKRKLASNWRPITGAKDIRCKQVRYYKDELFRAE